MKKNIKVMVSGGGTGGHIFPAISIANAIKAQVPEAEILFVGAENRMEMEKVPAAGYDIVGLPVSGLDRTNPFRNFKVIARLIQSAAKARKIVRQFQPDIAVGVGGYASGPTLWAAGKMGIPTVIQEQNSYAGVTNKLLAAKARKICVAYENMERFFPKDKIIITGNPVRQDLVTGCTRDEAVRFFGLDPEKKTILVIGGSLGALTINESIADWIARSPRDIQLIWQTGKSFDTRAQQLLAGLEAPHIRQMPFISRMDMAYRAADLVISRAGASSISELCLLGKPVILVPSPNVAEDHQTKNAQALESRDAAILIRDAESRQKLMQTASSLIRDDEKLAAMQKNIEQLAQTGSAARIADIILQIVREK